MSMSKLVFNNDSFQSSNKRARTEADRINYVTNVLLLHNGMVSKFEVKDFLESGCVDVDRWILVLSRKMVKELVLGFDKQLGCFFLRQYRVPACLFDCEDLNKLVLEGCELRLPSHYEGFRYLTHLDLHYVDVTKETIEGLVEKSPLLLYRKIWSGRYISIDGLNICAPNLIDCSIVGVFEGIGFHNVPKLEHVFLNILDVIDCTTCKLDEVLFSLGRIHSLNLFYPFMDIDILDREVKTAPRKLGITYCDLKVANLVINFNDSEQIYAVLCLCRSAPNLEELIIQVCKTIRVDPLLIDGDKVPYWEGQVRKEGDIFHHLKAVSLSEFEGECNELGFAEFILLNAAGLETLNIKWNKNIKVDKELLHVLEHMMQFKRASAESTVVFSGLS